MSAIKLMPSSPAMAIGNGHTLDALRLDTYHWLMTHSRHGTMARLLARMLASQMMGMGAMPRWLGLSWRDFSELLNSCFHHLEIDHFTAYGEEVDLSRADEHMELRDLFLAHADMAAPHSEWLADILVAGCMGADHLWQDLGLWSRADLKELITLGFGPLADKNVHDMKWKKFFYKQLCIQEGIYTCRAPSCQVCHEYAACFGPE